MEVKDTVNPYKDKPEIGCFEKQVFYRGFKAGIREVVEWIKANSVGVTILDDCHCPMDIEFTEWDALQSQLKEWGINGHE